jgi:hypothetical protein
MILPPEKSQSKDDNQLPLLTIIIVTYNSGDIFQECLASIEGGLGTTPYELIIVDNLSTDGSAEVALKMMPQATVLVNLENRGFASANNIGLAQAQGEYLLLLNPDVICEPGALTRLIDLMNAESDIGVVGARAFGSDGKIALTAYGDFTPVSVLWNYLGIKHIFPDRVWGTYFHACRTSQVPFEVAWVTGSCFLIRRDVYKQIGGLDDQLFLFAEEPDYCDRARRKGWKIMMEPRAVIHHHESTSVSQYPLTKMRHYHISPMYYFRKRGQHAAVRLLKIGFMFELSFKICIRGVQNALSITEHTRTMLRAYMTVMADVWRY